MINVNVVLSPESAPKIVEQDDLSARELSKWLERLEALDSSHIELGLERVAKVTAAMNLRCSGKIITIAGTNGKGTSAALFEHFLSAKQESKVGSERGFSVGVFTSPHLFHFRERIRICGKVATDEELVLAFEKVEAARKEVSLTYFEVATLAAAFLFSRANLDFWVLEVGLGGRLDAVNVFEPDIALVTNIGLDHTDWLGDTLELIAEEKAGIFRCGKPAIYASDSRPKAIDRAVERIGATAYFAGIDFGIDQGTVQGQVQNEFWCTDKLQNSEESDKLQIPALDNVSVGNLQGVLMGLGLLGVVPSQQNLNALKSFSLPGRFTLFSSSGTDFIADVAHNAESAQLLAERLQKQGLSNLTAVLGYMADKPAQELIRPLTGLVDKWIAVKPSNARAATLTDIASTLKDEGVPASSLLSCEQIERLPDFISQDTTVIIYGSFYTVSESIQALGAVIE